MNPVIIIIFVIEICAKYYREILLSFNLRENYQKHLWKHNLMFAYLSEITEITKRLQIKQLLFL